MVEFLDKSYLNGPMLYKGSRDGFSYDNYITKVFNKPNLFYLIQTEHDKIFGCFISIPRTQSNKKESDPKAFIFSLTHKQKHK